MTMTNNEFGFPQEKERKIALRVDGGTKLMKPIGKCKEIGRPQIDGNSG